MPFLLTSAPATFQRALDIILPGCKGHACLIYLNDMIAFPKTLGEHITHVDAVLTSLRGARVSLKM